MDLHYSGPSVRLATVQAFLPRDLRDLLAGFPKTGDRVHFRSYHIACALARDGVSAEIAAKLIRHASTDCGRYVPPNEIQDAISNAYEAVQLPGEAKLLKEPRPVA